MQTSRRAFLGGLAALVAAPAIVRAGSIMSIKMLPAVWNSLHVAAVSGSLHVGDILTFGDIFAVHRASGKASKHLRQFVVTRTGPFDERAIYPSIITEGHYRTVVARPSILKPKLVLPAAADYMLPKVEFLT